MIKALNAFSFWHYPKNLTKQEWNEVETGIAQRLKALNLFLEDIYNEQLIIKKALFRQPWLLRALYSEVTWYKATTWHSRAYCRYRFN
jgi:uncharacterized circularly permuted ATP-grasp superfamily protein